VFSQRAPDRWHDEKEMDMEEHKIVHWELMGPDAGALKTFYTGLFGWSTQSFPGMDDYFTVDAAQSGIGGAIGTGSEEMPTYQTIYVEVGSVDEFLGKAEAAGGATVMPRTVIPGTVTFGLFTDPVGNLVGVVEAETPPAAV
jgi:predicted enzyme related to lactoylglutathione lyase